MKKHLFTDPVTGQSVVGGFLVHHWRSITATVAVLGTLGAVASFGAEVQSKLTELEQTTALAQENTETVDKLVELHEKEAVREEYEEKIRELMEVIAEWKAKAEANDGT